MKAFSKKDALELGMSILERFESGLNGKEWKGRSVVLPFILQPMRGIEFGYPMQGPWTSSVEMQVPYFFLKTGPRPEDYEHVTLDEWLKLARKQSRKDSEAK